MSVAKNLMIDNVRLLKSEASKTTYQGMGIALASIVVTFLILSYYYTGSISIEGFIKAQSESYVLWILESLPFIFGLWGQYSSTIIAYQAGALIFDQTQELRTKADSLEYQAKYSATHDLCTDLPNRSLFYDRVEQAISLAKDRNKKLSVLLLEVSNFKEVNDTLGLNSSDLILKQIATRLQSVILGTDSVARIDGNLFSILLPNTEHQNASIILAKNIQKALEPAFKVERLSLAIHTNIGIVNYPEHGDDVDTLVQKAGVALFMANQTHEGYIVYSPSYDDHSPRRLTLMNELRQALENNQLQLFYQPKISVPSGSLYGAEALVRWMHPRHGMISPDEFVPMAERTRVIKHLTFWVLKQSFEHCSDWHKQGLDITISVNLSSKDLHDPELPDIVAGIAASTGIEPNWIMLEITESSIMNDPERALIIINRLHQMGYKFSIDDFGTGYSSLAYLKKIPLTELKIDKSFVFDVIKSESDAVIVNATINLAHNLGLQVTAEGVENEDVLEKLARFKCDLVQGYHFSKPLAFEDFHQWMMAYSAKQVTTSSILDSNFRTAI
jgi:diguanylate cyclase (GGDEF)-like protein